MRRNNFILANPNSATVKLHLDPITGSNAISGYGPGFIALHGHKISHPVIVMPGKIFNPWPLESLSIPPSVALLRIENFAPLLDLKPELVLFGSGATFRFPNRDILAAFAEAKIGFEIMDTPAACRTYNVLLSEGREIAAALLFG